MKKLITGSVLALMLQSGAFASDYDYSYSDNNADDKTGSFYAGVGAGLIILGDARYLCNRTNISCKTYKAWAGYRPSDNWAVEGGYTHFFNGHSAASDNAKIEGSGLSIAMLGLMPVKDNIEGFAKVGFTAWSARTSISPVASAVASSGSDLLWGGGAQMKINENVSVRGELEHIGGDLDSTNVSAGISYSTF